MTGRAHIASPPADCGAEAPGEASLLAMNLTAPGLAAMADALHAALEVARQAEMWAAAEWSYVPPPEVLQLGWTDRKAEARRSDSFDPHRPWRGLMQPEALRLVTALEALGLYDPHEFAAPLARPEEETRT